MLSKTFVLFIALIGFFQRSSSFIPSSSCRGIRRTPLSPSKKDEALRTRTQGTLATRTDASSMILSVKSWFDDDLPNILGINPIEAAILFGALYYFYGPNVLYEYAREAGKLFATYAPIVKEVATDIFYEFRDYLEEDREREMMRKAGVEVDDMPRRTTNALERFSEGLESFTEAASGAADNEILQSAYSTSGGDSDLDVEEAAMAAVAGAAAGSALSNTADSEFVPDKSEVGVVGARVKSRGRKSKKEVLESRNVDIDRLKTAMSNRAAGTDANLKESVDAVKGSLSQLQSRAESKPPVPDSASFYDFPEDDPMMDPMMEFNQYDYEEEDGDEAGYSDGRGSVDVEQAFSGRVPSGTTADGMEGLDGDKVGVGAGAGAGAASGVPRVAVPASAVEAAVPLARARPPLVGGESLATSKFQQQMSGQWNQRVLRRDKYAGEASQDRAMTPRAGMGALDAPDVPDRFEIDQAAVDGAGQTYDRYKSPGQLNDASSFDEISLGAPARFNDVPEDLSVAGVSAGAGAAAPSGISPDPTDAPDESGQNLQRGVDLLKELDRDYMALRQKFVGYLQEQDAHLMELKKVTEASAPRQDEAVPPHSVEEHSVEQSPSLSIEEQIRQRQKTVGKKGKYWPPLSNLAR